MKIVFLIMVIMTTSSFAENPASDWQSLTGQPGEICTVNLLESHENHLIVQVSLPGFWLGKTVADRSIWDHLELPEFYPRTAVGLPEVPSVPLMFALPFGTEAVVTVEDINFASYPGVNLLPTQLPEIDSSHDPYPFSMDENAYTTNNHLPDNWAHATSPSVWGGINCNRLVINPFRFNPVTKELLVAESITIRIDFQGAVETMAHPTTESIRNCASRILINYDMISEVASRHPASDAGAAEYIFLTIDENIDALMPLIEFYQSVGYRSVLVSFPDSATCSQITEAIEANYSSSTTRFVLLAGSRSALPPTKVSSIYGDYIYGCITGYDYLPEVAVGRLPGNASQIETQVNKIINSYYQYSFADGDTPGVIPSTSVLAAHQEDYPRKYTRCCNRVAAADYGIDMTFTKVYPDEGGTNSIVESLFNSNVGIVVYRGHGNTTNWSWSAPGRWLESNIKSLTNTFTPPVLNIACSCGTFQYPQFISVSQLFAWHKYGASGNLGATFVSFTTPNDTYMKQIFLNLYKEQVYNITEALNNATVHVLNTHPADKAEHNARTYVWFGDPAMEIFTNDKTNPTPLAIRYNPAKVSTGQQTITITVSSSGSPVNGATVGLSDGIDGVSGRPVSFFKKAVTDKSGQATFTVNIPYSATALYTGARLHNYNPVTALIDVYNTSIHEDTDESSTFTLSLAATQNPVTSATVFNYSTPVKGLAALRMYDVTGRLIETLVNEEIDAGYHSINWTSSHVTSGVYFVRLSTPTGSVSVQAILLD